jgi:ABC-type glycerol-3-phosphate transport system substrate-binding protein
MNVRMAGAAVAVPISVGTILRGRGALIVALAAVTGLAACGSDKSPSAAAATPSTAKVGQEAPVPTGPTVNVTLREASDAAYVLAADQTSVKAGNITFHVTDTGQKDHEMVILKLDGTSAFDKLAIDSATNKVSEDTNSGETATRT